MLPPTWREESSGRKKLRVGWKMHCIHSSSQSVCLSVSGHSYSVPQAGLMLPFPDRFSPDFPVPTWLSTVFIKVCLFWRLSFLCGYIMQLLSSGPVVCRTWIVKKWESGSSHDGFVVRKTGTKSSVWDWFLRVHPLLLYSSFVQLILNWV